MKTILLRIILSLSVILLLGSCQEDIDIQLKSDEIRLVVEGFMHVHGAYVRLSKSGGYFDNRPVDAVTGAKVFIVCNSDTLLLSEHPDHKGYYVKSCDFVALPENLYKLHIENVDLHGNGKTTSYQAESFMHQMHDFDKIELRENEKWELWEILYHGYLIYEPLSYYKFQPYLNGRKLVSGVDGMFIVDTRFYNGEYLERYWAASIDYFDVGDGYLKEGDQVCLEVSRIDKSYYDFIVSAKSEVSPKVPLFSTPSANVKGNISNGAIGVFTAYVSAFKCMKDHP